MKTLLTNWFLTKAFFTLIIGFLNLSLYSQADLVITSADFSPKTVTRGDDFKINLIVKNTGNVNARQSFMFLYFSKDSLFSDTEEVFSRVSVKSLAPSESVEIKVDYPIPNYFIAGTYYLGFKLDVTDLVFEINNLNLYKHVDKINVINSIKPRVNLPYPIIFIHGLAGDSDTWDELLIQLTFEQGLAYGGRLDFCLNSDNNTSTSNIINDYKDFTNLSNLTKADFYVVNFAVGPTGIKYTNVTDLNQSNQSAIFKQGRALKDAIKHVLQITGSKKVILVGHSMGGLAAREYLQNPNNYQPGGKHQVAKLVTVGTPHGGSNFSGGGIGTAFGYDELSEAVRDLRISYYTNYPGAYLFGGIESTDRIRGAVQHFKNVDVNCNGAIGNTITGLNQKSMPNDLPYACIIGTGSSLGGDGIVLESSANLNNHKQVFADTFMIPTSPSDLLPLHLLIHKNGANIAKGLDEANDPEFAYEIELNKLYKGFSNIQSQTGYLADFDSFKFLITQTGQLELEICNIPVETFRASLFDQNGNEIGAAISNGRGNIRIERQTNPGTYYLDIESQWTNLSYKYPYTFRVNYTPLVSVEEEKQIATTSIYPNPASDESNIYFQLQLPELIDLIISDMSGRTVVNSQHHCQVGENHINVDLRNIPAGAYALTLRNGQAIKTHRLVVVK